MVSTMPSLKASLLCPIEIRILGTKYEISIIGKGMIMNCKIITESANFSPNASRIVSFATIAVPM